MSKVLKEYYIEHLPFKTLKNGKRITNWESVIGNIIIFKIEGVEYPMRALKHNGERSKKILLEYENYSNWVSTSQILNQQIRHLIGLRNNEPIYKVGEVIDNKLILYIEKYKKYWVRCTSCNNTYLTNEYNLKNSVGCGFCSGRFPIVGVTDLYYSDLAISKLLKYPENAKKYYKFSLKSEVFICPKCGKEVTSSIRDAFMFGVSCSCSGGISRSENIFRDIFYQIGIVDLVCEYSPVWAESSRYDFYIPSIECIIECHGGHHYKGSIHGEPSCNVKLKDNLKKQLALDNCIKTYVEIDASSYNIQNLFYNIKNSALSAYYNFDDVDLNLSYFNTATSKSIECINLWNESIENSIDVIMEKLNISRSTVTRYIREGIDLGLCEYNFKDKTKKISYILVNERKTYVSLHEIKEEHGMDISYCLKRTGFAGLYENSRIKKYWMKFDDWNTLTEQEMIEKMDWANSQKSYRYSDEEINDILVLSKENKSNLEIYNMLYKKFERDEKYKNSKLYAIKRIIERNLP